ncbi:MAG: translation elongation factor Ts [Firmicutes bacterium]|nr:translation elongation factor Ts [Bacillota bacterium]
MDITASLVKDLREKTGAGMMDCKKALVETNGNIDLAIDWLREKGIAKAAKKESRIAAEGLCEVLSDKNKAIVFELNCETDFVSQNERFIKLVSTVGNILLNSNALTNEEALLVTENAKTLQQILLESVVFIGEKISLRRYEVFTKTDNQVFGLYKHMGGKIVSLSILNGGDFQTAKDIAMHVAASSPKYLSQKDIAPEIIVHEKQVLTNEALNENETAEKPKPQAIILKMVEGRLNKNLKEICLVNQAFIKNPDQSVEEYVKSKGATIASFTRLAVGEGIEKKEDNFADEVLSQVK